MRVPLLLYHTLVRLRELKEIAFSMIKRLFFGTNNAGKLREIKEVCGSKFEILSYMDFSPFEVEETEDTLAGNAILKAKAFYTHTGIPCFADDTGLEVNSLGGEPGVYSARYAGYQCNPIDNMQLLLKNLRGKPDRNARFVTIIAYYDGKDLFCFEGEVKGEITLAPQGNGGFGYDPIFKPENQILTFAEMSQEAKNKISHRAIALQKFVSFLMENS